MATIATQPQAGYRPGPWWMALFLVAAAGIGAGTVALVQTMTSEGATAGRTAVVSSVEGAAHARALNQPEVALPAFTSPSFGLSGVRDLRALNETEATASLGVQAIIDTRALNEVKAHAGALNLGAIADARALNSPAESAESFSLLNGVIDARALNEPSSPAASSVQAVENLRSLNR